MFFSVDQFHPFVLHQSELKKTLRSHEVVPIFCVSSTHSFQTEYEWTCDAGTIGVSSPVLYVTKAGVYQCLITDEEGKTCASQNVEVVSGLHNIIMCTHFLLH